MIIIPAIDLKDGLVVRYTKGRYNKKVYSSDPVAVAMEWKKQGAKLLHIVDLDGALNNRLKNLHLIKQIINKAKIDIQVGGGIRSLRIIRKLNLPRVKKLIIGTRAITDESFFKKALSRYNSKIALGLDTNFGKIGLYGWKKFSRLDLLPLLEKLEGWGLKNVIYTDIQRDGTLGGINTKAIIKLLKSTSLNVIVSGGVASLNDIRKLAKLKYPNLKGVIAGKALYEGRFTLKEAMEILEK